MASERFPLPICLLIICTLGLLTWVLIIGTVVLVMKVL